MAFTFRKAFYKLVPKHYTQGEGELLFWCLNRILDAYDDIFRAGLVSRFPSYAGESALTLIGQERGIPRGRSETAEHYVERLRRWRYPRGHRTRGSAFALLEQVSEYWGGMTCATFDVNQTYHARNKAGEETWAFDTGWNWDGTGPDEWARFWLVLVPGDDVPSIKPWPTFNQAGNLWGGGTFAEIAARDVTLGQQGVTGADIRAMRRLFKGRRVWKPAGRRTDYAILVFPSEAHIVDDAQGGADILDDARAGSPTITAGADGPVTIEAPDPAGLFGTVRRRMTNAPNTLRFWRVGTVVVP